MKKFLKPLSGALALTLALSSAPMTEVNAAFDPFLLQPAKVYEFDDPMRLGVEYTVTEVEQSNHTPQRVDLTPEQIQGLVASTLSVIPEVDSGYKLQIFDKLGLNENPYQPMHYECNHSKMDYPNIYFTSKQKDKVEYLGDYTIGGVLDPTKVVYESRVSGSRSYEGALLTNKMELGSISYDEWLSKMGTNSNIVKYQAFYRTTYNYAIIVNGQNSPTFNVGTNILAIISPLGDRMYFDVFGLDTNGNVYIPDGYHYYDSLLNISYQKYKHNLGICKCTGHKDKALIAAIENSWNTVFGIPSTYYVNACSNGAASLLFSDTLPAFKDDEIKLALQKINGKNYTPVVIK